MDKNIQTNKRKRVNARVNETKQSSNFLSEKELPCRKRKISRNFDSRGCKKCKYDSREVVLSFLKRNKIFEKKKDKKYSNGSCGCIKSKLNLFRGYVTERGTKKCSKFNHFRRYLHGNYWQKYF